MPPGPSLAAPVDYSMGFLMSLDGNRVALIRKNRPARLVGKLTGIGGHRECGETFLDCIVREMREEAGVATRAERWRHFATVCNSEMFMQCYVMRSRVVEKAATREDEPVAVYGVADLDPAEAAPLALELIALARIAAPNSQIIRLA